MINPPVDTDRFKLYNYKENFYITVARLVPYKKIDLIVEAFNNMSDKKLVVIGDGEDHYKIAKIANKNVVMLGFDNGVMLTDTMQRAKAFVYVAVEDFGIVPIEAMACGTPVIALDDGGTTETVIDGANGVHFKKQTTEDICEAVKKFEKLKFDPSVVRDSAMKYTYFKDEFKKFVDSKCKN